MKKRTVWTTFMLHLELQILLCFALSIQLSRTINRRNPRMCKSTMQTTFDSCHRHLSAQRRAEIAVMCSHPFGLPYIWLIRLLFSAGTMFFSHDISARTVFSVTFSQVSASQTGLFFISFFLESGYYDKQTAQRPRTMVVARLHQGNQR